ncbi:MULTISPECIES: DUF1659 domain-containing protein [unclassified Lactobacillus]|uniref:DUF1659 domain-containing protein n=1 Tax=unclassified Lactobacillus TaxID=2620435 RepID=UPI000EFAACC6|nr:MULTISPECIES: DUF1659 domain-containing protein [unclassified Lactobacillus]RMC38646.1 DUF1659 domain-containing protein [Lactobacillus sp. ESL0237]RMC42991.1 DUF1659 domain-containing protein [Lactobacillus sp. ESL0234]RMC43845.1 DUF1659 domain-containing protein [Lactobacillus sp. ESL0236]RMC44847.1 DUF1659 domain-containing protein [Lactobacillus sp. ESL0230]RMC48094.1 DUF1659 domain-containing protein [Lactobacillus sp. ESL0225]
MNFELIDQAIEYTFVDENSNSKKGKNRIFPHVKKGATATGLAQFGTAIASLQGNSLGSATLIQKQAIKLNEQD